MHLIYSTRGHTESDCGCAAKPTTSYVRSDVMMHVFMFSPAWSCHSPHSFWVRSGFENQFAWPFWSPGSNISRDDGVRRSLQNHVYMSRTVNTPMMAGNVVPAMIFHTNIGAVEPKMITCPSLWKFAMFWHTSKNYRFCSKITLPANIVLKANVNQKHVV